MGSISDAIDAVTEEDVATDDTAEETTEETTSEETAEEESDGSTILDEEDEAEEGEEEIPDTTVRGDVEGEETEESDASDIFDQLTTDELAEIKANPTLNKLRKSLMRGFSDKTASHSQLVQLGNAYRQDPVGVLRAMAQQLGMEVRAPEVLQPQKQEPADPGRELEELFGEQIGPKVRAVFDKWAEARFGQRLSSEVAPLRDALGRVVSANQAAAMHGHEADFKSRHPELTPSLEKAIVDLGNSGRILPGRMNPQEYLETLYDIASARMARDEIRREQKQASSKLARKIESNRRDREPTGVTGRGNTVKPVSKVNKAKNISEALDLALIELEAEERR